MCLHERRIVTQVLALCCLDAGTEMTIQPFILFTYYYYFIHLLLFHSRHQGQTRTSPQTVKYNVHTIYTGSAGALRASCNDQDSEAFTPYWGALLTARP